MVAVYSAYFFIGSCYDRICRFIFIHSYWYPYIKACYKHLTNSIQSCYILLWLALLNIHIVNCLLPLFSNYILLHKQRYQRESYLIVIPLNSYEIYSAIFQCKNLVIIYWWFVLSDFQNIVKAYPIHPFRKDTVYGVKTAFFQGGSHQKQIHKTDIYWRSLCMVHLKNKQKNPGSNQWFLSAVQNTE